MEHQARDDSIGLYCEYAPSPELRPYVRALAWYGPAAERRERRQPMRELSIERQAVLTPSFADAQTSLLFSLGMTYSAEEWREASAGDGIVMGALTRATQPDNDRAGMLAAYLTPLGRATLFRISAADLTNRTVLLRDLWRRDGSIQGRPTIDAVEALLTRRLAMASPSEYAVRTARLASHVAHAERTINVQRMADLAGVSRQHLARVFHEHIGVSPKLYTRLARFRTTLRHLSKPAPPQGWSGFAEQHGYADQSHLIADFREFTGHTPGQLARGDRFHPFIGDDGM